jgi:hypothetical protein
VGQGKRKREKQRKMRKRGNVPDTYPMILLHLLEEVRGMEPQHLPQIPRCTRLLGDVGLPAVRGLQILDPHPTGRGRVDANAPGGSGPGGEMGKRTGRRSWRWRQGRGQKIVVLLKTQESQG